MAFKGVKRHLIWILIIFAFFSGLIFAVWYFDIIVSYLQTALVIIFITIPSVVVIDYIIFGKKIFVLKSKTFFAVQKSFNEYKRVYHKVLSWHDIIIRKRRYQMGPDYFEDFLWIKASLRDKSEKDKIIIYNLTTNDIFDFIDNPTDSQLRSAWFEFNPLQIKKGFWQIKEKEPGVYKPIVVRTEPPGAEPFRTSERVEEKKEGK